MVEGLIPVERRLIDLGIEEGNKIGKSMVFEEEKWDIGGGGTWQSSSPTVEDEKNG